MPTWVGRILKGDLGWKTCLGSALIVCGVLGHAMPFLTRDQSDYLVLLGVAIGFLGLRDAVAKLARDLTGPKGKES